MKGAATERQSGFLPYGGQHVTEADITAVVEVLRSDWWTQGPAVPAFERQLAEYVGAEQAVACSSGTAALHLAMLAYGISTGDEVVTSANTFLASANCARFVGAEVRFTDIDPATGLMDPRSLEKILQADKKGRIKVIIPVHFAGQPMDLEAVSVLAGKHGAYVVDDVCHALGAWYETDGYKHRLGGSPHSDASVFSFHPIKHVAMGEGGAVTTGDPSIAERLRRLRNHGMRKDEFADHDMALTPDGTGNPWYYEMQELGYNYRLTDIQAALGVSQLSNLPWSLDCRSETARLYREQLTELFPDGQVRSLSLRRHVYHAYHLFVVSVDFEHFGCSRAATMERLREAGIGTQVHYIPVPLQPYYRRRYRTEHSQFPNTWRYYSRALSLPMFAGLRPSDVERVVNTLYDVLVGKK